MRLPRTAAAVLLVAGTAAHASAEDRCVARGKMQDQSFELRHCAVAMSVSAATPGRLEDGSVPTTSRDRVSRPTTSSRWAPVPRRRRSAGSRGPTSRATAPPRSTTSRGGPACRRATRRRASRWSAVSSGRRRSMAAPSGAGATTRPGKGASGAGTFCRRGTNTRWRTGTGARSSIRSTRLRPRTASSHRWRSSMGASSARGGGRRERFFLGRFFRPVFPVFQAGRPGSPGGRGSRAAQAGGRSRIQRGYWFLGCHPRH